MGGASPYSLNRDQTTALPGQNNSSLEDKQSRKKNFPTSIYYNQSENNTQMKETLTKHSVLVYSFPQQILIICRTHFTVLMVMLLHFTKNRCLIPLNIFEKNVSLTS